jgi:hypothetical protein
MNSSPTSTRLLSLPDTLIRQITNDLNPQSIRRLCQTNRKLSALITPHRIHQAGPLANLSIDILFCILDHLSPSDRSRLARTSYSLYPPIMDFVLRDNVVHNNSSILTWAAKKDLRKLAQRLLDRGADIDTTYGVGVGGVTYGHCSSTPLIKTVFQGHVGMMEFLLEKGATHKECGKKTPVSVAMFKGNQDMCLRLLQHLDSIKGIHKLLRDDTLKDACDGKFARVVQNLLSRMGPDTRQIQLDEALFFTVRKGDKDDTLYIASMLLKAGANPDVGHQWCPGSSTYTARELRSADWWGTAHKLRGEETVRYVRMLECLHLFDD